MILAVSDSTDSYLQFLTVLILFAFVLAVTYWATRWISGYQKRKSIHANIELMETFQLTNNKYIQLIRVGQKYLAVAIGKDSVTMLAEIPEEQLNFSGPEEPVQFSFKELLEKVQKKDLPDVEDDRDESK